MKALAEALEVLTSGDGFLLTTHLHPDGDGLGSMLALGRALKNRGKSVEMVMAEGVPSPYTFLAGAEEVRRAPAAGFAPSLVVALDCGDRERMALPFDPHLPILNIDHHLSNDLFGRINLVDPEAAATGEIVHRLLVAGGYEFDAEIATALYVAVATDTGFFRYTNATRSAFTLAARLVEEFSLEPGKIAEVVHEQKSLNAIMLLGLVLATIRLALDGTVAWMYLSQEMLARYPVEIEETEGFINYARSIVGVEIALFFKEARPGEVRVSWRSGPTVDVSQMAAYFGGGGHARAAGCTIQAELKEAVKLVLDFLASWHGVLRGSKV
ncbi:MAG: bifunctional oligoribonuclease/PAP phosphatase NrnA [Firmicutes bacterium]|nr:bifunctional oligoribonuclease/PAP phosphatase NrnA [Bacillota bacterium]